MPQARRRFLTGAAGISTLHLPYALAPSGTGSNSEASPKTHNDVGSVTDFGGRGDWTGISGTENSRAFERAIENCRIVKVPPGNYMLERAVIMRTGVHIVGAGPDKTMLTNVSSDVAAPFKAGFILGNLHPYAFDQRNMPEYTFPTFQVEPLNAGAVSIRAKQPDQATKVKKGDFVFVRTEEEALCNTCSVPHFAQLTKVRSTPDFDGKFEVTDKIYMPVKNPLISAVRGVDPFTGLRWHVVEDASVEHLSVMALDLIAPRSGCVRVLLDDLRGVSTRYLLGLNAFCHSRARNISGDWSSVMLEIKMGSYGSCFEQISGRFWQSDHTSLGAISIGEQSFQCSLKGVRAFHPRYFTADLSVLNYGRCFDIDFTAGELVHEGSTTLYPAVRFGGHDAAGYPPARNELSRTLIRNSPNVIAHIHVGGDNGLEVPTDCRVLHCHMLDQTRSGSAIRVFNAKNFSAQQNTFPK